MSLARVASFGSFPQRDCGGRPASRAILSSLPATTVPRANCACWASASTTIDTEAILTRLRGSILLYDELVPLHGHDSISLHVWRLIKQLPLEARMQLLDLPPKGFRRLWKLSGGLLRCSQADAVSTIGAWSLADDFPEEHDTSTWKYRRGVVWRRHFGIVHKQIAFFSSYDGDIVGLVQRKKWYKPWAVHTTSFDVDVSPGLVVPGTLEPVLMTLSNTDDSSPTQQREFFRCVGPGVYIGYAAEYGNKGVQGTPLRHMLLVKEGAW